MNKKHLTGKAQDLALALWREQIERGISERGEKADPARLDEWLANRTYGAETLNAAAVGDVEEIAYVRNEAGLPILS